MTASNALFVDWGWASTGAAWIDLALWLLWLIAHGHTPAQAATQPSLTPRGSWPLPPGLDQVP
ncbi:hypothetical protein ACWC09_52425 [Streptomyces sp. NPDC001617]